MGVRPHFQPLASSLRLGESAQGEAVPDIPSDARQLTGAVSRASDNTRKRVGHVYLQNYGHKDSSLSKGNKLPSIDRRRQRPQ
jgi:hypothetical protein